VLRTVQRPRSTDAQVEGKLYAVCSLTYLLAMVSSNLSLQWVPYPTQVTPSITTPT
jgi:UDP-galactose transporter B1